MKVHCDLMSCQTYKVITSTEVETPDHFGLAKNNPFPASVIWTGSFFNDGTARITYIVRDAIGEQGTWEAEKAA